MVYNAKHYGDCFMVTVEYHLHRNSVNVNSSMINICEHNDSEISLYSRIFIFDIKNAVDKGTVAAIKVSFINAQRCN